jgi:hypothetical protein
MSFLSGFDRGFSSHRRTHARRAQTEALESRRLLSAAAPAFSTLPDALPADYGSPVLGGPGITPEESGTPLGGGGPPATSSLSPAQLRHFYGVDLLPSQDTGTGQTIAIVVANNDPTIVSDLGAFDYYQALPAPPSFKVENENGGSSLPTTYNAGWARETAIDVEWAHAFAPGANLLLIEAASDPDDSSDASFDDLLGAGVATTNATAGVSVVSMSFTSNPEDPSEVPYDSYFKQSGVTYLSATGDAGSASTGYPSTSPDVVAVGGTYITTTDAMASYGSEVVWNDSSGSTGGGISPDELKPAYQSGLSQAATRTSTQRTVPDVSLDASFMSNVVIYDSSGGGSFQLAAGTSVSTPCWAGLIAVADQIRATAGLPSLSGLTQTLPRLYALPSADFHDITTGNNNYNNTGGYIASAGYDLASGLGTPVANLLVPDLAGPTTNIVSGQVFSDNNDDGTAERNEPGVAGAGVYLDENNDGIHESYEPLANTDANGQYSFTGLPTGATGTVRVLSLPAGYLQAATPPATYTVSGTSASTVNLPLFPTVFTDATAGDAWTLQASSTNPSQLQILVDGAVTYTVPVSVVSSSASPMLSFNFSGTADSLTVDFGNGNPIPSGGVSLNGSSAANGDTLAVLGTGGNDTLVVDSSLAIFSNTNIGSGTISFSNVPNLTADLRGGTDSLTVNAGTVNVPAFNAGSGHLSRVFSTLSVAGGAKLIFASPDASADRTVVQVPAVSITGGGRLDLDGNDMIVTGSTLSAVNTLVGAGYANGAWSGAGIDSSAAASDTTHLSALGVVQNNQGGAPLFTSGNLFDGITPAAGAILIKSTYVGDANLSGKVDGSDYSLTDAGYAADKATSGSATGWFNGNFNYDQTVDGSDYALLDNAFNNQKSAIPTAQAAASVVVAPPAGGRKDRRRCRVPGLLGRSCGWRAVEGGRRRRVPGPHVPPSARLLADN